MPLEFVGGVDQQGCRESIYAQYVGYGFIVFCA